MSTATQQFTEGQRIDNYETLTALPVGTRLTRDSNPGIHWITNGDEATRYDEGGHADLTNPWATHGWVPTGWVVDTLPGFKVGDRVRISEDPKCRFRPGGELEGMVAHTFAGKVGIITADETSVQGNYRVSLEDNNHPITQVIAPEHLTLEPEEVTTGLKVGDSVTSVEEADALPVGTVINYGVTGGKRTKVEGGRWQYEELHDALPSGSLSFIHGGYTIESLPGSEAFKVGDHLRTVEQFEALPVGAKVWVERAETAAAHRTKTMDGNFDYMDYGSDMLTAENLAATSGGYFITELPSVTEPTPVVDNTPLSPETVRQFKARFRSLALSSSHGSSIDLEPVFDALDAGGFTAEDPTVGLPVYGADATTFASLPDGTVLKHESEYGGHELLMVNDDEVTHFDGDDLSGNFVLYKVVAIPGYSTYGDAWVHETMTTEEAKQAHRDIERLKVLIWDLGLKGKKQSAENGSEWCGVFEETLGQEGIDHYWAVNHGWEEPPPPKEDVTVTVTIDGVTSGSDDYEDARHVVGGSVDNIDSYRPATVEWTHNLTFHNIEVDEDECGCGEVGDDDVRERLNTEEIDYSSFEIRYGTCDNC